MVHNLVDNFELTKNNQNVFKLDFNKNLDNDNEKTSNDIAQSAFNWALGLFTKFSSSVSWDLIWENIIIKYGK